MLLNSMMADGEGVHWLARVAFIYAVMRMLVISLLLILHLALITKAFHRMSKTDILKGKMTEVISIQAMTTSVYYLLLIWMPLSIRACSHSFSDLSHPVPVVATLDSGASNPDLDNVIRAVRSVPPHPGDHGQYFASVIEDPPPITWTASFNPKVDTSFEIGQALKLVNISHGEIIANKEESVVDLNMTESSEPRHHNGNELGVISLSTDFDGPTSDDDDDTFICGFHYYCTYLCITMLGMGYCLTGSRDIEYLPAPTNIKTRDNDHTFAIKSLYYSLFVSCVFGTMTVALSWAVFPTRYRLGQNNVTMAGYIFYNLMAEVEYSSYDYASLLCWRFAFFLILLFIIVFKPANKMHTKNSSIPTMPKSLLLIHLYREALLCIIIICEGGYILSLFRNISHVEKWHYGWIWGCHMILWVNTVVFPYIYYLYWSQAGCVSAKDVEAIIIKENTTSADHKDQLVCVR